MRKPRPRVAVFYVFSTLPASGRFASEGSFVLFLVCFRTRYYCTLRSWVSRNKEPRLLSSRNSCMHTCNLERYAAALATANSALACEDQTKVCVYARLPRGAKLADSSRHTRFVSAILGLSCRARIRGLRKTILGWCDNPRIAPNIYTAVLIPSHLHKRTRAHTHTNNNNNSNGSHSIRAIDHAPR